MHLISLKLVINSITAHTVKVNGKNCTIQWSPFAAGLLCVCWWLVADVFVGEG